MQKYKKPKNEYKTFINEVLQNYYFLIKPANFFIKKMECFSNLLKDIEIKNNVSYRKNGAVKMLGDSSFRTKYDTSYNSDYQTGAIPAFDDKGLPFPEDEANISEWAREGWNCIYL